LDDIARLTKASMSDAGGVVMVRHTADNPAAWRHMIVTHTGHEQFRNFAAHRAAEAGTVMRAPQL
jgi:hypothetical protein